MTPESWTGLYIFDLALLGKPLLKILYVQQEFCCKRGDGGETPWRMGCGIAKIGVTPRPPILENLDEKSA